jgi:alkane 1-monooxygenase
LKNTESEKIPNRLFQFLEIAPIVYTVLYICCIFAGAWYVSVTPSWYVLAACISTVGVIAGVSFSATHELIHSKGRVRKVWGRAGLLSVAFMHFEIEHLCGHHRFACTVDDASTARFGEGVYAYLIRSIPKGIRFSWEFETNRLKRNGLSVWHPANRMIWYAVLPLITALLFFAVFDWRGMFLYIAQAIIGFLVMMIAAYIEHYGVLRIVNDDGTLERISAHHSWDSYHFLSGAISFNVQRHSDHHLKATKKYPLLESHESAIELPAGYQAMIALALVPPLWRKIMDPLVPAEMVARSKQSVDS